ncbi:unnamed protein product, partial [Cyprideis torosa]
MAVEKASRKLKEKKKQRDEEAAEELSLNVEGRERFQFPRDEEELKQQRSGDLSAVQHRIQDVFQVLADFSKSREAEKDRQDYLRLLCDDLCSVYGYNEWLMRRLMDLFSLGELMEFLEANQVQRPVTLRVNSLKTRRRDLAQALISRGVNLDPLGEWTKVGLVVYDSQVPLGATPEYQAGHYLIQGASSLLPVMSLAPKEGEKVLDLCAAPGGKSTHLGALMKNSGLLFCNDANGDRAKAVVGNLHRMGITNACCSVMDGREMRKSHPNFFDRVLLDAPCSGTGVISKDPA